MEDLFNILSSSARLDKSKRRKPKIKQNKNHVSANGAHDDDDANKQRRGTHPDEEKEDNHIDEDSRGEHYLRYGNERSDEEINDDEVTPTRNRQGKKEKRHSATKLSQIHAEEIAAFRRRMGIRLSRDNKHDSKMPDPISSFKELKCPSWWHSGNSNGNEITQLFHRIVRALLVNIENGRWVEPTAIQMQCLPALVERRDVMGCAPTGSGKSGAFILPALLLAKCPEFIYYKQQQQNNKSRNDNRQENRTKDRKGRSKKPLTTPSLQGHVRVVLLAPSRELASQLHREVTRLGHSLPNGKLHTALLSKSNAGMAQTNRLGGKSGLDVLVSTPLRLVECIEKGMALRGVRLIVLDEADRLLDASDGGGASHKDEHDRTPNRDAEEGDNDERETSSSLPPDNNPNKPTAASGSSHSSTFLEQIDSILSCLPSTATRALFSATLGASVRNLSESILRNPIDVTTGNHAAIGGNAAAGGASETIVQELKFVGREEGKLLAIRQMVQQGLTPPILIFLQSKERAQALFGELLYDGICVDVIHAGRSASAREASVAKFRKGDTWVLICTDLVARGVDFKAVNLVINYDLPLDGVTYVHRIGRTGRAGREGKAITFFTEADFDNLRTIANVMKLSGCQIPDWMLTLKQSRPGAFNASGKKRSKKRKNMKPPTRGEIDTTPLYDKKKKRRKEQLIKQSKQREIEKSEVNDVE